MQWLRYERFTYSNIFFRIVNDKLCCSPISDNLTENNSFHEADECYLDNFLHASSIDHTGHDA